LVFFLFDFLNFVFRLVAALADTGGRLYDGGSGGGG
jgi:hypothetical protein